MEGKSTLDTAARIQQLIVVTRQLTVRYTVHHATSRRKSNSYEDLWALSRPTLAFPSASPAQNLPLHVDKARGL
jgi:hypothetical protein